MYLVAESKLGKRMELDATEPKLSLGQKNYFHIFHIDFHDSTYFISLFEILILFLTLPLSSLFMLNFGNSSNTHSNRYHQ